MLEIQTLENYENITKNITHETFNMLSKVANTFFSNGTISPPLFEYAHTSISSNGRYNLNQNHIQFYLTDELSETDRIIKKLYNFESFFVDWRYEITKYKYYILNPPPENSFRFRICCDPRLIKMSCDNITGYIHNLNRFALV